MAPRLLSLSAKVAVAKQLSSALVTLEKPVIGHDAGCLANFAHLFPADVRNRNPSDVHLLQAVIHDSVSFAGKLPVEGMWITHV